MDATGVESLFDQVRIGLTTLVDLLAADELQAVDACERLDLWQDVHAVLAQLTVVERALALGQLADRPSATDISVRRRDSAARVRRRSSPRPPAEVTGLLASR